MFQTIYISIEIFSSSMFQTPTPFQLSLRIKSPEDTNLKSCPHFYLFATLSQDLFHPTECSRKRSSIPRVRILAVNTIKF